MARETTKWPSTRWPITKIMSSDGCNGNRVPLEMGPWYDFREFGCHLGNVGLQEFYQVTFRKKIYETIEQLQNDLDEWIDHYNNERTHQGKICEGRTPMQTLEEGKAIWREKFVA